MDKPNQSTQSNSFDSLLSSESPQQPGNILADDSTRSPDNTLTQNPQIAVENLQELQLLVNQFQEFGPVIGVSFQQTEDQLNALMHKSTSRNEFNLLESFEQSEEEKENESNEAAASVNLVDL